MLGQLNNNHKYSSIESKKLNKENVHQTMWGSETWSLVHLHESRA